MQYRLGAAHGPHPPCELLHWVVLTPLSLQQERPCEDDVVLTKAVGFFITGGLWERYAPSDGFRGSTWGSEVHSIGIQAVSQAQETGCMLCKVHDACRAAKDFPGNSVPSSAGTVTGGDVAERINAWGWRTDGAAVAAACVYLLWWSLTRCNNWLTREKQDLSPSSSSDGNGRWGKR